jgi:thioredoxin-dependent peroxiredoxin
MRLLLPSVFVALHAFGLVNAELRPEWTTPLKEGDDIPDVNFQTRVRVAPDKSVNPANPFVWKVRNSRLDYFPSDKRYVVFALPGAFTPTCSTTHLPGYEEKYDEFIALGIADVYCLSVNDAFVMRQWGLHQGLTEDMTLGSLGFTKVKLIPDGSAAFTRAMGYSNVWDETERGFGERSWRYAMVVSNGKIEKIFEEAGRTHNSGPDPFEVSDAGTVLAYLRSSAKEEL